MQVFALISWCQSPSIKIKKTVLQAFWWDYKNDNYPNGWANYLTELAPRLKGLGIDAVWIPPSYKNQSPNWVGYGPMDHYDLGDKYQKGSPNVVTGLGTKDELLRMIAVMHANGIEVIQDIVLNHVDGAGSSLGQGGVDPIALSVQSNNGYKNFRYTSFATPAIDESENDYFTRNGRWSKNYTNFYPNSSNVCCTNDINSPYFGPDIAYESNSYGPSSNIPTMGSPSGYPASRPYFNPPQSSDYMRTNARNWLLWFKKQTGVDGLRWDAVKHFPINVQEDLIYNVKYTLPTWAKGGQTMLNIGEWIGSKGDIDGYVNAVATGCAPIGDTNNGCPTGSGREEHTGTFDFNLRGYGSSGGLYSMVRSGGSYDLSAIPGEQQDKRYFDYTSIGTRVHRSFSFVNSHDTYRPILDANGDFTSTLSNSYSSGWNSGNELGGNGGHLDPREPRLAAAYAIEMAMDGNPVVFMEDIFNIGTLSKRWTHDPKVAADLPVWNDLDNLLLAHQKLQFKDGDYKVRTAETNPAPYHLPGKGNGGDHIVFEREGKALIGVTDYYNAVGDNTDDREVYVTTSFPIGTLLYDYSGSHGILPVTIVDNLGDPNISRVLIKTAPVGHTISGAYGHGYSIWAPAPGGMPPSSVQDLYNHLSTFVPMRNHETIQEWEMEDDLGDSHCISLGQGGRLPANSCNQRVAGKIYVKQGEAVTMTLTPTNANEDITLMLYDKSGNRLKKIKGSGILTDSYIPNFTGWVTAKIRNTSNLNLGQKCFVRLQYIAPETVTNAVADSAVNTVYIWTSNGGSGVWADCGNWESGRWPQSNNGTVIIPECVDFQPIFPQGFAGVILFEPFNVPLASSDIVFKATKGKNFCLLDWKSSFGANENTLERASGLEGFKDIATIKNSERNADGYFQFKDQDVSYGKTYYYRVSFVDETDNLHESQIETVDFADTDHEDISLIIYPNPVFENLNLYLNCAQSQIEDCSIEIINVLGQRVFASTIAKGENSIKIDGLKSGAYFLILQNKNQNSKIYQIYKL